MLSLSRIFLHNWHRFKSVIIEVENSLYFIGHNGSGKSTILDAMQVILLAELNLIKFNSSAQEKSARTLNGFVRGKLSETRWLRPGNCIGYIALEFCNTKTGEKLTLGCCIEAGPTLGDNGERAYFILRDTLDTSLLIPQGRALTRLELKKVLQKHPKGKYYDHVREYQPAMLDVLGGLNPRFFNLFQRALSFKPINNIGNFVEQWLLSEHQLDLHNLQYVVARLRDLRQEAERVEKKLKLLEEIAETKKNYYRYREIQIQYEMLHALLRQEQAERAKNDIEKQLARLQSQLQADEQQLLQIRASLEGARAAKTETERELYGLDVVRQRDEWEKDIARKEAEATSQRNQKQKLLSGLQRVAHALQRLAATSLLQEDEWQTVQHFIEVVHPLTLEDTIPSTLAERVDSAIQVLDRALEHAKKRTYSIQERSSQLRERAAALTKEIEDLRTRGAIAYPPQVDALRTALERVIGERPAVLCELLEVPAEQWQRAVEAMLGARRFTIIVQPQFYPAVLRYIDTIKENRRFHDASVLDLERVYEQGRPARPNSLALQVKTNDSYLRAYVDAVLGNIITCASAEETRQYDRAITPDLIYYGEWAIRILPSKNYELWYVGQRARQSQIEAREQELHQIREELLELNEKHTQATSDEQRLNYGRTLAIVHPQLASPPDDKPLCLEIEELKAKIAALDMSTAEALTCEIQRLEKIIEHDDAEQIRLSKEQGQRLSKQDTLQTASKTALAELAECKRQVDELTGRDLTAEQMAKTLLAERSEEPDLTQAIANAQSTARRHTTLANDAMTELSNLGTAYNVAHQFAGLPGALDNDRYAKEQERLQATELPSYIAQIEQAQSEAEQELREHVLHNLRERITYVKEELRRINDALRPLDFHGDHYRFIWDVEDSVREYYHLINDSEVIGVGPLFESSFYEQNKETFDRFYAELTQTEGNPAEKAQRSRLTDYRTYLTYDIEVKHIDGTTSRLSKIMGETSGGETQTPFYLTIAASFVQLYHIGERGKYRYERPMMCLIVFDEAFNKMDQDRIGVTLDMFQRFGLQVVTATPLERCEYLVPKMCTNLVITRVGEDVFIDDYRNYAATLEKIYAE